MEQKLIIGSFILVGILGLLVIAATIYRNRALRNLKQAIAEANKNLEEIRRLNQVMDKMFSTKEKNQNKQ